MRPAWSILPTLLSVAAAAPAQQRQPLVGVVRDAAGTPAPGATVTLFWTPPGDGTGVATDVVEVACDARGRFVAALLPHVGYSGFARGAGGAGGAPDTSSEVRNGLAAGGDAELRLQPRASSTLRLVGIAPWRPLGPLRAFFVPRAQNLLRLELALQDDAVALPPLPRPGRVVLADRDGQVLHVEPVNDETGASIEVAEPFPLRVTVTDASGARVPGAVIEQSVDTLEDRALRDLDGTLLRVRRALAWRRVGVVGEDGTGTFLGSSASSAGYRPKMQVRAVAGPLQQTIELDRWCSGIALDLPFTVVPGVRVTLRAGRDPLAGRTVTAAAGQAPLVAARTDRDGGVRLADAPGAMVLVVDGAGAPSAAPPTIVRRARPDGDGEGAGTADREVLDVGRQQRRVSLQLLQRDGGPARAQGVLVLAHPAAPEDGQLVHGVGTPFFTDQAGRLELSFLGGDWLLFACDGTDAAWRSIDATDAGEALQLRLRLEPLPNASFRIVDGLGGPVAGVRVGFMTASLNGNRTGEAGALDALRDLLDGLLVGAPVSDATGLLRVPFLPHGGSRIRVQLAGGGKTTGPVELVPAEEPLLVTAR